MVPLVIIAIILLPPMVSRGYTKKCPHCAEIIKEDAKFCKHCGLTV
ncbi:MAG: zinc-ribbon domain-containing protein [Bacteroidetes bacterium]|nr:zinc-ribbon domain-containing protein [Bacteroidota bacterium]